MTTRSSVIIALAAALLTMAPPGRAETEANDFVPPPDNYDWIQLTSDEWLKGQLINLYEEQVEFDSEKLGVLFIDWEDIRSFRGHKNFRVSVAGRPHLAGDLAIDGEVVTLKGRDKTHRISRGELVAITPVAATEFDNWSGDATLGINIRQGNTDTVEYDFLARLERLAPRSRLLFDYVGNFNKTDEETLANSHRVTGSFRLISGEPLYWRPVTTQYFRDPFQNIGHQLTLESGLGYDIIDNRRTDWQASAGLGVNYLAYESVEAGQDSSETSPALTFATEFETEVTSWMDYLFLLQVTLLDEDSGTYQHHLVSTLSTDLIGNFDLDITLVWDRIENPQQRSDGSFPEQDDFRLTVGVGYEF
jgi:hypothetical protein